MGYVIATANLYGQIYNVKGTRDYASIRTVLETADVPAFIPSSSVKIHLTDEEMKVDREKQSDDAGELFWFAFIVCYYLTVLARASFIYCLCVFFAPEKARLEELKGKLSSQSLKSSAMRMCPINFEKVRQEGRDASAALTVEAQTQQGTTLQSISAFRICLFFPSNLWILSDPNLSFYPTRPPNRIYL